MTYIDGVIVVALGVVFAVGIVRGSVLLMPNASADEHEEGGI